MERQWILTPATEKSRNEINWPDICGLPSIAALLEAKGFASADEVQAFLSPRLASLSDPFLLPNMASAVARILQAIDRRERIVLFGDYDVDGVTSLALLSEILSSYGAGPELFLPLRMEEGYGMSRESVDRCCEQYQPQLVIAVDCGTSSGAEIGELKQRGVDVIVVDHHEPKSVLPDCNAVVNPKATPDCPFDYLCSVGLVFKLCHALLKTRPMPTFDLKASLDLVALGTVADLVPLIRENRTLVQRGILELARSKRIGLRKLMDVAMVRPPILAVDIAFRLGPRLNAAGRLSTAEKALRLLQTNDESEAMELATLLDAQNRERQKIEKLICAEAESQLEKIFDPHKDASITVGAREWHPGVLGIVASRLARKYHRPAVVVGFDSAGLGKGSARSIDGLSLVEALGLCQRHLEKFGGHEMAAGLTIQEREFPAFVAAFGKAARELLSSENLQPRLHLDQEITFSELNDELLRWYQAMEPFGMGNRAPLFLVREVEPVAPPQILKEKHLVLRLRQNRHLRRAIFFDGLSSPLPDAPWDMAFRINANAFRGETRLEIQVEALRESRPTP